MELIQIGADALKVTLTKEDMRKYDIAFEQLDYENAETRRTLRCILEEAKRTIGFEATNDKLYIQAFKDKAGGCELFVRRAPKEKKSLLFRFAAAADLLRACARLQNCGFSGESRALLGDDEKWYLSLCAESDAPDGFFFLSELGTSLPHSDAFLTEHTRLLCTNAVFSLAALK